MQLAMLLVAEGAGAGLFLLLTAAATDCCSCSMDTSELQADEAAAVEGTSADFRTSSSTV
jgi:hypothetical protein